MPLWEVGSSGVTLVNFPFRGGGQGFGLLSSFLLLRIMWVRYLIAFWGRLFMSVLMLDFGSLRLLSCSRECS